MPACPPSPTPAVAHPAALAVLAPDQCRSLLDDLAEKVARPGRPLTADDSGYPARMLAFMRKKFVGSYLALRAVSRVHWLWVYA